MSELAIEAHGLTKSFGETKALRGVDLEVERGKVLGLLGPNGAGKTTAVRILTTLLLPDAGSARVAGRDVVRDADAVRRVVGLTGQYASVDEDLTGRQNLVMIARLLDMSRAESKERAAELLGWFDLADAADRVTKTYSGGMRRRLDLAASLVGRPEIVVLDEPTTGLDPAKREEMWGVVRGLVNEGSTVLLTTQYLEEAEQLADMITVIDHGTVIAHDTPDGLKRRVGGQTLEVRPTDPSHTPAVERILQSIATPGTVPDVIRPGVIAVPVTSDAVLAHTVSALAAERIEVSELSLHLPSLDEVFFALTGHAHAPSDSSPVNDNTLEASSR